MRNIAKYFIVSIKHTKKNDPYITLWNPSDAGYCHRVEVAGKYSYSDVMERINYYNNGVSTLAVPCDVINKLTEMSEDGYLDTAGHVIINSKANWKTILNNTITEPASIPTPRANCPV
jgi:hypothetical protein